MHLVLRFCFHGMNLCDDSHDFLILPMSHACSCAWTYMQQSVQLFCVISIPGRLCNHQLEGPLTIGCCASRQQAYQVTKKVVVHRPYQQARGYNLIRQGAAFTKELLGLRYILAMIKTRSCMSSDGTCWTLAYTVLGHVTHSKQHLLAPSVQTAGLGEVMQKLTC